MQELPDILRQNREGLLIVFCILLFSCFISAAATPLCKRIALKTGFMDVPSSEAHKLHGRATPLLGGIAILLGVLLPICFGVLWILFADHHVEEIRGGLRNVIDELLTLCFCAIAFVILGAADDKYALKAWKKFLIQSVILLVAVFWGGIRITLFLDMPFLTVPLTVFWLLFLLNGINFFDNMDGLAAGTGAIAFLFFATTSFVQGQFFVTALAAAAAGSAIGFRFYNASPASIFMGDCGSHLLGFLIGIISVKATYYNAGMASTRFSVLIPLFILAVPIFDTITVVCIRLYHHKPVYIGDHNHISHRFVRMGLSRKDAVRLIHLLELLSGLGALPLLWGDIKTCIILLLQGCILLLLLTLLQFNSNRNLPTGERPHD